MPGVSNAIFASNRVLQTIPHEEEAILRGNLTRVRLVAGQVLIEEGQATEHVFFIENGIAALLAQSAPAQPPVQITMIGREGLVGALALLGPDTPAFGRVVMLLPGAALRISVVALQRVFEKAPILQAMSMNWVSALTRQLMHAAASSVTDKLTIRCARWLLMAHSRNESDDLAITHELIATALGVQRAGVTLCVIFLQQAGLIRTRRGRITITDRAGMERLLEQHDGAADHSGIDEALSTPEPTTLHFDPRLLRPRGIH